MWRTSASRKGRHIINVARKLATEATSLKQNVPPPIPQPPSKSVGSRILKFIGLSLPVAAGGVVGYAWYDLDFRKQIEDNIPYAKELFENILPKNEERIPAAGRNNSESSLEKAHALNIPEEAVKSQGYIVSRKTVSRFDTYNTAQCSSEREESNKDENLLKCGEKHYKTSQDLYASYIHPSFGKANLYQQTVHNEEDNDTDDEDEEEEEEEDDEEDEEDEEEENNQHTNQRNGSQHFSEQCSASNLFSNFEDIEKKLTDEILTSRSKPFHILTVPEVMSSQAQKLQVREVHTVEDLFNYNDDRSSEKNLTTALHEKASEKSEKRSEQISPSSLQSREEDEKADNAALEVVIHKLATNSLNVVAEAVKAQTDVAACIRNQTKMLKQAMDDTSDILMKDAQWESVAVAYKERELAMTRANDLLAESKKSVEKLRDILQEGRSNKVTQNNPAIFPATKQLNEFLKELGAATVQVRQAEAEANVMQKYKDLVEKGKKQFKKEIESIIPSIKFGSGKKLTEEELSALIAHAHRRIEQLQRQIAEQLALERQRLTNALEAQRLENLKMANMALTEERRNMEREFEIEKSKMDVTYLEQVESEVRKQLARQAAAHSDHLRDVLAAQQQALSVEYNQAVHVKLLEERERFQSEVAGWISRLKGIEAAVEARATSEKLARCAQDLWLACIALDSVIHGSNENEDETQLRPLKSNVDVILEAGQKHPFVETVASAISDTALLRGVNTEDELRHRFFRVSRICHRLGLVDAANSSVYKYLISYLHSFVVLDNVVATVEGEEVDLTNLDNFGLLSHANYWMEKGHLDIALRFMIQLTGESRRAASDWIEEARLLLETKQIADTLMAYASATGLANTY